MISQSTLLAHWPQLTSAPKTMGIVDMLVVRRASNAREIRQEVFFSALHGMEGDRWAKHAHEDPTAESQISLMGARILRLIADSNPERMALAGDNIVLDLDLSDENLQAGDQLHIGDAIFEVTTKLHKGCKKFSERFGPEALKLINAVENRPLHLRGIFTRVIQDGLVRAGDTVTVVKP